MGTFHVALEIGDPRGERFEQVEALVDTGASYSMIPKSLLQRLRVTPHDQLDFYLADGSKVPRELGRTWVRVNGKSEITLVIFGDDDAKALLGAYTLEGLRLTVDPFNKKLVPLIGYLMSFTSHI